MASGDWIRLAPSRSGFERVEAFFAGHGFDPHRHDTYAMGFTLGGVQAFRYRGAAQQASPGQVFVLHPDELHDGRAGTPAGFRYRILYIEPRLIQEALGSAYRPLPFVRDVVSNDQRLARAIRPALEDLDAPLDELHFDETVLNIAEALAAAGRTVPRKAPAAPHRRAIERARELLDASVQGAVRSAELEAVTGLSRYALARHFRACLGTSPHRYLTLRRLDRARSLIQAGASLAAAALSCGFADQSHMTRQFRKAYGLTPGRWAAITAHRPAAQGQPR